MIAYKVKETGGLFIETPTRNLKPSQRCPVCWSVKKKALKGRVHQCEVCGCKEDRDIAAARVNLLWALNELGSETGLHRACSVKPLSAKVEKVMENPTDHEWEGNFLTTEQRDRQTRQDWFGDSIPLKDSEKPVECLILVCDSH